MKSKTKGENDVLADGLTEISTAIHTGIDSLDHLICMGLRHGLDQHTTAVDRIADALNRIADALEHRG